MEASKYIIFSVVFIFLLLPIFFIIFSIFFPNFQPLGFKDFLEIMSVLNGRMLLLFLKSVGMAASASAIALVIGFSIAIILEFTNISHKNLLRFLFFIPFLIPNYLFTFSWLGFLGKRGTFADMVFPSIPIDVYNPLSFVIFLSLSLYPISMFVVSLGLKNLDRNLVDLARLSGKKGVIKKIVAPLVKPHMIFSFFLTFAFAISEFTSPSFLRVNTYQAEVFAQLSAFYNVPRAVIYSFPLILLTILFSFSFYFYFKKISFATITSFSRKKDTFIFFSKKSKVFVYTFFFVLLLFSLIIPYFTITVEAGKEILNALGASYIQIINSIALSGVAALLITILGFFSYYFLRKNLLMLTIIMIPLGISSPVIGISLINLYSKIPFPVYGTILMVILGYVARFLPFSIFIFSSFLPQLSSSLEEYGRLINKDFFVKMQKIVLPLVKGGILSSFILIFILCLGEVGVTQMVSPPGFQTLSMRVEDLMHYGNYSYVASLSLVLLLVILLFYVVYSRMYRDL